jgi:uncharacterized membrane protein YccC
MVAASMSSVIAIRRESKAPPVVRPGERLRSRDTRRGKVRTGVKPPEATHQNPAKPSTGHRWMASIFAAKTTASALLALLIAFTFDLDQPKWAALTVFIVAQPQSGLVLAKSFYRIIGTVTGAAVALFLVSLFAQERVLFLGALAAWIGLCTYASRYARHFAAYGFVLSGYTVAIVGITGALDPANAFFVAEARVTEISLGIIVVGVISQLVLPVSLAQSLRGAVAEAKTEISQYATALLCGGDVNTSLSKLLGQVIAVENLYCSAVFEDRGIQERGGVLRRLDAAMLDIIDVAALLGRSLEWLRRNAAIFASNLDGSLAKAATAIDLWRNGDLDAAGLRSRLVQANAGLPLAGELYRGPRAPDDVIVRQAVCIGRLREFFDALAAFAEAYERFLSPAPAPAESIRFSVSSDHVGALWAGLRAALALIFISAFWILGDWPSGSTAAIPGAVATARLATMERPAAVATASTLVICAFTIPAFAIVEVLLPNATGFPMFALIIAPPLFFFAYVMAHKKTAGMGFIAALYFIHAAAFQNRMAYDPVGFLNISIAIALAIATAAALYTIVAPETPAAARRRFVRIARRTFARIGGRSSPITLADFETTLAEALDQLRLDLRDDRDEDTRVLAAGIALLGAGRELIRIRDDGRMTPTKRAAQTEVLRFVAQGPSQQHSDAQAAVQEALRVCLANLRDDGLTVGEAWVAAREVGAFAAIRDELEPSRELGLYKGTPGEAVNVA